MAIRAELSQLLLYYKTSLLERKKKKTIASSSSSTRGLLRFIDPIMLRCSSQQAAPSSGGSHIRNDPPHFLTTSGLLEEDLRMLFAFCPRLQHKKWTYINDTDKLGKGTSHRRLVYSTAIQTTWIVRSLYIVLCHRHRHLSLRRRIQAILQLYSYWKIKFVKQIIRYVNFKFNFCFNKKLSSF